MQRPVRPTVITQHYRSWKKTSVSPCPPYAVTKYVNELYADAFVRIYGFKNIGLRYFNVFGKHQDPDGAYAAAIPKWTAAMVRGGDVVINGDGETSRDFCFVENAVQANLLAAIAEESVKNEVYNVAVGSCTTLNELFSSLKDALAQNEVAYDNRDFRPGDVPHSQADIGKAARKLGYAPKYRIDQGISKAMPWYLGM